jgi:hypothetical protein
MRMPKATGTARGSGNYALGVDFGTESGRAVLVDVRTGEELASSVYLYANGVIDDVLPSSGVRLPPEWALQDSADYLHTLTHTVSGCSPPGRCRGARSRRHRHRLHSLLHAARRQCRPGAVLRRVV